MLRKYFWLIIVVFLISVPTFSQTNPVDFSISLADGKKVFRKGEPVRVVLSFVINQPNYKIRMNGGDKVNILPKEGVFDWKDQQNKMWFVTDHVFAFQTEYKNPTNITISLNDFVRFDKVGKYSVNISTTRVYFSEPNDKKRFGDKKQQPAQTSNTVDFEIKEMSEAEEAEEIKRLSALIATEPDWQKNEDNSKALSYLTGDASTTYKVNQFLHPPNYRGNYSHHISTGLRLAPNKDLAIKLLENALYDLNREIRMDVIYKLVHLQYLKEIEASAEKDESENVKIRWEKREKRFNEIKQKYLDQLFQHLSARKDKSRITTAITIFQELPKDDASSEALQTTKAIILDNFDNLNPYDQLDLLERFWEKIKTPSLTSSIVKILSENKPPQYATNATPLKRLLEIDENLARPFIINEIKNPNSYVDIKILSQLKDEYLPEVDEFLLNQIREAAENRNSRINLRGKNHLAARFATKKIYDELMKIYLNYAEERGEEDRGGLLAYFLRHNEKEAIPLIEERLKKWDSHDGGGAIFYNLTQVFFSKGTEKILRQRLDSSNPRTAGTVAYYLSRNGSQENRKIIENRYNLWLKKWMPHKAEFDKKEDEAIQSEKMLQVNLVESLKNAKSWKLSEKELEALKQTCLSEECLRYFPKN